MKTAAKIALGLPLLAVGLVACYVVLWLDDLDRVTTAPDRARRKGAL